MYELVRQKNTGYRKLPGIIVFVFISLILKVALHESPTTLNDDMIKAANDINSHAPIVIDSTTRFDTLKFPYLRITVSKSRQSMLIKNGTYVTTVSIYSNEYLNYLLELQPTSAI